MVQTYSKGLGATVMPLVALGIILVLRDQLTLVMILKALQGAMIGIALVKTVRFFVVKQGASSTMVGMYTQEEPYVLLQLIVTYLWVFVGATVALMALNR